MTTWKVTAIGPSGKLKARYNRFYIFDAFCEGCAEFSRRIYGGRKHSTRGRYKLIKNDFKYPPKDAELFSCPICILKQYTGADPIFFTVTVEKLK